MPLAEAGFAHRNVPEDQRASLLIRFGPTLQVTVGHLDAKDPAVPVLDGGRASESVYALVDADALESCVDDQLAKKLALPVIDRQQCAGVGGPSTHDVYLALVEIPALAFVQYGRFMGVHLAIGGQQHQALLGRTLLDGMVMIYDGAKGSVTLAR